MALDLGSTNWKGYHVKKLGLILAAAAAMIVGNNSYANDLMLEVMNSQAQIAVATELGAKNVINWKVGDHAEYNIHAMNQDVGKLSMRADREEGNAVWMIQDMTGFQKQKVETLIDRLNGKTLKYIVNGQEQAAPADKLNIVSQDQQSVTVPAGTFDAIHIVATTDNQQVKQMEIWANPRDILLSGMAQTKIDTTQGISVLVQLLAFGHQ